MPLPGCTQASIEMNFQSGCTLELIVGELGHTLKEVVRYAHGSHCVRARGARSHLVELLKGRHNRALGGLHHIEFWRKGRLSRIWRSSLCRRLVCATSKDCGCRRCQGRVPELTPVENGRGLDFGGAWAARRACTGTARAA